MMHALKSYLAGSLRRQLITSIFVVFLLFIGTITIIVIRLQTALLHEKLVNRSQNYGKLIASTTLQWVMTDDLVAVAEGMDAAKELPEVQYVAVIDLTGKVLGHTDPRVIGKYLIDKNAQQRLDRARQNGQPVVLSDNLSEVESAAPLVENGRTIGFVRVRLSGHATVVLIRHYALRIAALGLVLLLIGTAITFFISQRIIGSIPTLTGIVSGFKIGEAIPLMAEKREDEVGVLARQIRLFMTELNAKDKEVKAYQQGLEAMVNERTAMLEEKTRELAKINKLFIGRENRMAELKKENSELRKRLGETS
jgi:HAMP domain-containing protein